MLKNKQNILVAGENFLTVHFEIARNWINENFEIISDWQQAHLLTRKRFVILDNSKMVLFLVSQTQVFSQVHILFE